MNKWKTKSLKDLTLQITDGKHGDCQNQNASGYFFISCKDIYGGKINYDHARQITHNDYLDTHKRTRLEVNDILITNSGTIGRMAFINNPELCTKTTFQKSVAIVKPDSQKIYPKYLYYLLQNLVDDFINSSNGSAQKNLLLSTMRSFSISYLEDIKEQRKIEDILSAYDDLIENNRKQIRLLEEAAHRLYKEWFIDLRFPGHENTKIINGIPAGWEKKCIGDICQTIGGGTPSTKIKEYYQGGTIKWVTPTDITRNNSIFLLDTEKKITNAGLSNSSAKLLPPFTILMTSRASVGYFALCEHEVCTNQGFISCIPHQPEARYFLLYNLMNRVDEIRQKAGGSTYLEINKNTFRSLSIIYPVEKTCMEFTNILHPIMKRILSHKKTLELAIQSRNCLLPKLMTGELERS